jgi:hypothetical protein
MRAITIKQLAILLSFVPLWLTSCKKDKDENLPTVADARIDTRGLDYYIKIAETLLSKQEPPQADWDSLLATPVYKRYIDLGAIKPEEVKEEMRLVYKEPTLTADQQKKNAHHLNYKANLANLKSYSASLKDGSVRPLIKQYLFPYLPARLQKEERIPTIVYTFFFREEATAYENSLVQDALLSYKWDSYAKGLLSAHEAYHFITGESVTKRTKLSQSDYETPKGILAFTLLKIAQEGVADLIDKDIVFKPDSPFYEEWKEVAENEEQVSKGFLGKLNEAFIQYSQDQTLPNSSQFLQTVTAFGGHQPGRYMGKAIKQAGLLEELKVDVENPYHFLYMYNKSATQSNGAYPILSSEALDFLRKEEPQIFDPLK